MSLRNICIFASGLFVVYILSCVLHKMTMWSEVVVLCVTLLLAAVWAVVHAKVFAVYRDKEHN